MGFEPTILYRKRILSPSRMPVPPRPHITSPTLKILKSLTRRRFHSLGLCSHYAMLLALLLRTGWRILQSIFLKALPFPLSYKYIITKIFYKSKFRYRLKLKRL